MSPGNPANSVEQKVDRAIAAIRARIGAPYDTWRLPDGWRGNPIYGDRLPSVEEVKRGGLVCSSILNIACHVNGITPPMAGNFRGGTGAWAALARTIGEPFEGPGTILRPGDIVGSPYRGAKLRYQGHVALCTTGGLPREARVIQADAFGGFFGRWNERKGRPGLNEKRTVAETNAKLARPSKWTYIIRAGRWLG